MPKKIYEVPKCQTRQVQGPQEQKTLKLKSIYLNESMINKESADLFFISNQYYSRRHYEYDYLILIVSVRRY